MKIIRNVILTVLILTVFISPSFAMKPNLAAKKPVAVRTEVLRDISTEPANYVEELPPIFTMSLPIKDIPELVPEITPQAKPMLLIGLSVSFSVTNCLSGYHSEVDTLTAACNAALDMDVTNSHMITMSAPSLDPHPHENFTVGNIMFDYYDVDFFGRVTWHQGIIPIGLQANYNNNRHRETILLLSWVPNAAGTAPVFTTSWFYNWEQ